MPEFFRHCPECGRRFHIKLEGKKMIHMERDVVRTKQVISRGLVSSGKGYMTTGSSVPVVMEGSPIIMDVEEFQYQYKCGHCGHEWSEKRTEEHKEG